MVAIISGNSMGVTQSAAAGIANRGNLGQAGSKEKAYVNIATGNVVLQDQDALMVGRGVDVALMRTYNSQGKLQDDNGDAWWINGYRRIGNLRGNLNQAGSQVERVAQDGAVLNYQFDVASQSYLAANGSGSFDSLRYDGQQWTWTQANTQLKEQYQGSAGVWKLVAALDANGNTTRYAYTNDLLSKITNANGETVEFSYQGRNLVEEKITQADGKALTNTRYRYDAQNRLQQVIVDLSPDDNSIADGKIFSTTYSYVGNSNLLASVTQTDGSQQLFEYVLQDGVQKVATITDAQGQITRFAYDAAKRQTSVTDAHGNVNIYLYDEQNRFAAIVAPAANGQTQSLRYQYDSAGNLASLLDSQNNLTRFSYDGRGNLLTQTDALGNRKENTYDAQNNLLSSSVISSEAGSAAQTTRFVYDEKNNLRFQLSALGRVTEQRFDAYGQRTASLSYLGTAYAVDGLAQAPQLQQMLSWAQGQNNFTRSDFAYNARGQVSSITQYATVNPDGTGLRDGSESVSNFSYDVAGNLLMTIDARRNQTSYSYDGLQRVISSTNAVQQTTYTEYDDANRKVIQRQANGRVDTQLFDKNGHLLSSLIGGEQRTEYRYDALGRLAYSKDATGVEQLIIYDAAGNIDAEINGQGEVTQYRYNNLGQKIATIVRSQILTNEQLQQLKAPYLNQTQSVTPAPTPVPAPTATPASAPAWDANTFYTTGQTVSYLGQLYKNRWDTMGASMTSTDLREVAVWQPLPNAEGYSIWRAELTYHGGNPVVRDGRTVIEGGEIVAYEGQLWQAQWYHQGSTPSIEHNVWLNLGPIPGSVPTPTPTPADPQAPQWSASKYYPTGSIVTYLGAKYQTRWDTMGATMTSTDLNDVAAWAPLPNQDGYSVWRADLTYHGGEQVVRDGQTVIEGGEIVAYEGKLWQAQWYHQGTIPSAEHNVWRELGPIPGSVPNPEPSNPQAPAWVAGRFYPAGSIVTYLGAQYKTRWDTMGTSMTSTDLGDVAAWAPLANSQGFSIWRADLTYHGGEQVVRDGQTVIEGGEIVAYEGQLWQAQWYHQATTPSLEHNVWKNLGAVPAPAPAPAPAPSPTPTPQPLPSLPTPIQINLPLADNARDLISRNLYDALGRLAMRISSVGEVTQFEYDANGNLLASVQRAFKIDPATIGINTKLQDVQITADAKDRISLRYYDQDQRLIASVDAEGFVREHRFDLAARSTLTVAYAKPIANPQRGIPLAQLFNPTVGKDAYSYEFFDASNRVIATVNAEGYATSFEYDQNGQVTTSTRHAKQIPNFASNAQWSQIKPASDAQDLVVRNEYDAMQRLSRTLAADGSQTTYNYDAKTGQLLSSTQAAGTSEARQQSQRFDQFGRLIASLSAVGSAKLAQAQGSVDIEKIWQDYAVTYQYDAANRRISSTDQNQYRTLYFYDLAGRLTHTINALGEVQEQVYNELGQQTANVRYGTRLPNFANLNGGLVNADLQTRLRAIADVRLDSVQKFTYDAAGRLETSTDANQFVTRIDYNEFGEKKQIDSPINSTEFSRSILSYNKRGQLTEKVEDALGLRRKNSIEYDAFGRVVQTTDANGNLHKQEYDRLGRSVKLLDVSSGHYTQTSYDAFDRVLTQTDARGKSTIFSYDTQSRSISITSAEGVRVTRTSNRHGQALSVLDGNGNTVSYEYDANGQLLKTNRATNLALQAESNVYDRAGLLLESFDANGNATVFSYDAANRVLTRSQQVGTEKLQTRYTYDAKGQQITVRNPNQVSSKFEYDLKGQLKRQTQDVGGLNLVTEFAYDAAGNTLRITNKGEVSDLQQRFVFDHLGRRTEEYADGVQLSRSYQYDGNNNVISSKDALGKVTRFAYDSENRQILRLDAAGGMTRTVYDENGRVKQSTQFASVVSLAGLSESTSKAELLARLPNPSTLDQTSYFYYDNDGRTSAKIDAMGGVSSFVYDKNGNVLRQTQHANRVDLASGAPAALSLPAASAEDRVTRFTYDASNRLQLSIAADGAVSQMEYDGVGNLITSTAFAQRIDPNSNATSTAEYLRLVQANPALDRVTRRAYDAANRLVYAVDALGFVSKTEYLTGPARQRTTQYDKAVHISSSAADVIARAIVANPNKDRSQLQEFDAAGRLVVSTDARQEIERYYYNALGQKTQFTNKKGAIWNYTYDAAGRLASETGPAIEVAQIDLRDGKREVRTSKERLQTLFAYDGAGNLLSRTEAAGRPEQRVTKYEYDALGRQVKTIFPSVAVYKYDAGRAVEGVPLYTEVTYDVLGNAVMNRDVGGKYSYKVYDKLGQPKFDIDAKGYVTEYTRNRFGEVEALTRYAQVGYNVSLQQAPNAANFAPISSAADRTIRTRYDVNGQAIEVTEPVAYGMVNGQTGYHAKFTRNAYNAFGELVRNEVGHNIYNASLQLQQTGVEMAITRFMFDQRGMQVAKLDAENYLTRQSFDAAGNLVLHTEFANPYLQWNDNLASLPAADASPAANDRVTRYEYDAMQRKTRETRYNLEFAQLSGIGRSAQAGTSSVDFTYDALGNLLSSVEQEVDTNRANNSSVNQIGLNTRITYNTYDAMGWLSDSVVGGTAAKALQTSYKRDAYGNAAVKVELEGDLSRLTPVAVPHYLSTTSNRVSLSQFNAHGKAILSINAEDHRSTAAYDAFGNLARQEQNVTDADGSAAGAAFVVMGYDELGKLWLTIEAKDRNAAVVVSNTEYNAFGEMTRQAVSGNTIASNEYDNAGHVWRSRGSDQVDKLQLTDHEGRVTLQMSSSTIGEVAALSNAASSANLGGQVARTEIRYDRLGHITQRNTSKDATGSVLRVEQSNLAFNLQTRFLASNTNKNNGEPQYRTELQLKLPDTSQLGWGDVKVIVRYKAFANSTVQSKEKLLTAQEASASNTHRFNLGNLGLEDGSDLQVSEIVLQKKNVEGRWVEISKVNPTVMANDNGSSVNAGDYLRVSMPNDPSISTRLQFRRLGSNDWINGKLSNFGEYAIFDPKNPQAALVGENNTNLLSEGSYEYRIDYLDGDNAVRAHTEGSFALGGTNERVQAARLFVMLFNRAPTVTELDKWSNDIKAQGMLQTAQNALSLPEFAGKSAQTILNQLYTGALGRSGIDAEGLAYWLGEWGKGTALAQGTVITSIVNGNSQYSGTNADGINSSKLFNNKVSVALTYAGQLAGTSVQLGTDILRLVTPTDTEAALTAARVNTRGSEAFNRLQLTRLYVLLQNRAPDKAGLDYWVAQLATGTLNMNDAAASIYAQCAFVTQGKSTAEIAQTIYQSVLGRSDGVDEASLKRALDAVPNDVRARSAVLLTEMGKIIADSSTDLDHLAAQQLFNNRVNLALFYSIGLGGNSDTTATALNNQITLADPFSAMRAAQSNLDAHNQNRLAIARMYVLLFNRAPETTGFAYWLKDREQLNHSLEEILGGFLHQTSLENISNEALVKRIYTDTLGVAVPSNDPWLARLNQVGQTGNTETKQQVFQLWLDSLTGAPSSDPVQLAQQNLFLLKTAASLSYVALGGDESGAANVLSAAALDMAAIKATQAALTARGASPASSTSPAQVAAAVSMASAALNLAASAAALASAKAQAMVGGADVATAERNAAAALETWKLAVTAKTNADEKANIANTFLAAAENALGFANAAVATDQSIARQVLIDRLQRELREAQIAAGQALGESQSKRAVAQTAANAASAAASDEYNKRIQAASAQDNISLLTAERDRRYADMQAAEALVPPARNERDAALAELSALQNMNQTQRTQIYQLYVLLFNNPDPDAGGVAWWMRDLANGASLAQVASNMYSAGGLSSRDSYSLMDSIYRGALGRNDADEAGKRYWASELDAAPWDGRAKGQVFLNLIGGVLGANSSNWDGYTGMQNFTRKVSEGMARATQAATQKLNTKQAALENQQNWAARVNADYLTALRNYQAAPDPQAANAVWQQAVTDLGAANQTRDRSNQEAAVAEGIYNSRAQDVQRAESALASVGTYTPPSSGTVNDLAAKLADYFQKRGVADAEQIKARDATAELQSIRNANPEHLRKILQLYVLMFNRTDPDPAGVSHWLVDMSRGASMAQVASNMYIDYNWGAPLSSQTPTNLIGSIYRNSLGRTDNDVEGIAYWARELAAAPNDGHSRGQVFVNIITAVEAYSGPVATAASTRLTFLDRVAGSVNRALSNANTANNLAEQRAIDANNVATAAYTVYTTALNAAGGSSGSGSTPPQPSASGNNLAKLLQVYLLLSNSRSLDASGMDRINDLANRVDKGTSSLANAAYELYRSFNGDAQGTRDLIRNIFRGALACAEPLVIQENNAATELENARSSANNAGKGQALLNIVSTMTSYTGVVPAAVNARTVYDQALVSLLTNFVSAERTIATSANAAAGNAGIQLGNARTALDSAESLARQARANVKQVLSMNTAPQVNASSQQYQIARLYALILNRAPDAAGLAYWLNNLNSLPLETVAQQIISGVQGADGQAASSDTAFVNNIYTSLGSVNADRVAAHIADLASKSRGQVVVDILNETLAGQNEDAAGWNRQQMLANKVAVGLIYAINCNGEPVAVARNIFNMVSADTAMPGIFAALASVPGMQTKIEVATLYVMLMGRTPDLDGFNYWCEQAGNTPNWASMAQRIIAGDPEHSMDASKLDNPAFLNKLYTNTFGRAPDADGMTYWLEELATKTRGEVAAAILYNSQNSLNFSQGGASGLASFRDSQKVLAQRSAAAMADLLLLAQAAGNLPPASNPALDELKRVAATAGSLAHSADLAAAQSLANIGSSPVSSNAELPNWTPSISLTPGQSAAMENSALSIVYQTNDRWGNALSISDARNSNWLTRYHYDSDNRLLETRYADGSMETRAYNNLGQFLGSIDAKHNYTIRILDALGNAQQVWHADGGVEKDSFSAFGERLTHRDQANILTSYSYTRLGQVAYQETAAVDVYGAWRGEGQLDEYGSNDLSTLGSERRVGDAPQVLRTSYAYDELGRRVKVTDAKGGVLRTFYDFRGNVRQTDAFSHSAGSNVALIQSFYDDQNHKIEEINANGVHLTWQYTNGRLSQKTDIGGHVTNYSYDGAGQLLREYGSGGYAKDIRYSYTVGGQLAQIDDKATNTISSYSYDAAGNRVTERVLKKIGNNGNNLVALQNNYLSYDSRGRVRQIADARYQIKMEYDANGNRTRMISSYVTDTASGLVGSVSTSKREYKETYNAYDNMNRQIIADGVIVSAVTVVNGHRFEVGSIGINATQGHFISYDAAGKRRSDSSYGKTLQENGRAIAVVDGYGTETYEYDAAGRLTETRRDNILVDQRFYDAGSMIVRSGVTNDLHQRLSYQNGLQVRQALADAGISSEYQLYKYRTDNLMQLDWQQSFAYTSPGFTEFQYSYDTAGNMLEYKHGDGVTVKYEFDRAQQYDQYQATKITSTNAGVGSNATINSYDVNGHLVQANEPNNVRYFYVDNAGHVLRKEQQGELTYSLLANGELYGSSNANGAHSKTDSINQSYTRQSLSSGLFVYVVQERDTLPAIARAMWGDASLWYMIADANGLTGNSETELRAGSNLLIPNRVSSSRNSADTFRPYRAGEAVGDLTPGIPQPPPAASGGGCGGLGQLIMVVVAVAAASLIGPAALSLVGGGSGLGATIVAGAITGAASSAISQVVGIAIGAQDGFSWKGVALGAIGGGVSAAFGGVPGTGGTGAASKFLPDFANNAIGKAMVGNVLTQGIGVATGLQSSFDWRGVAAAGVSAAASSAMSSALNRTNVGFLSEGRFANSFASGFAGGVGSALVRGGKVDYARIATDAFGNALGSSLAESIKAGKSNAENTPALEKSGWEFWAKLQVAKEKNDFFNRNVSGDPVGDFIEQNFALSGGSSRRNNPLLIPAMFSIGDLQNGVATNDFESGYTGFANLGMENGIQKYGVTYHYGEGEKERLRLERNAIELERLGQRVHATTNASMMGLTEWQKSAEIDADIAAGKTGFWDAVSFASSYTFRKLAYEAWNIGTAGFVARHDARLIAQAEGRLSDKNFLKATAIDSIASVGSVWLGGRVGDLAVKRLGSSYLGSTAAGGGIGGTLDLVQQTSNNLIYDATGGQSGRSGFSSEEFGDSIVFGAAMGGGGKFLADYGHYNVKLISPRPGTLYSTPFPFELVPPKNPSAYSVLFETKLDPVDWGRSREVHFNRANEALENALKTDSEFARLLESVVPNIQKSVASFGGREKPVGWTWEHASSSTAFGDKGVMRLVPTNQHTSGSVWWRILHPDRGAAGGYAEWAIPNGAPKNR